MQAIHKNKDERSSSRRANAVDIVVCVGKIGRYLKGKCNKRFRE